LTPLFFRFLLRGLWVAASAATKIVGAKRVFGVPMIWIGARTFLPEALFLSGAQRVFCVPMNLIGAPSVLQTKAAATF
jgi:hypothetical protein